MSDDTRRRYNPIDDCPKRLDGSPCPLYGGPLPDDLDWGPPAGAYAAGDVLPTVPGPDVSKHKFGTCAECTAMVMFDTDEQPMKARARD